MMYNRTFDGNLNTAWKLDQIIRQGAYTLI